MSKAKFEAAKELIQEKKYDEARALLKTINHPTAREWEAKLDKIAPPRTTAFVYDPAKKVRNGSPNRLGCIGILIVAIVILIALLPNTPKSNQEAAVISSATPNLTQPKATKTVDTTPIASATITDTPQPTDTPVPSATPTLTTTPSPVPTPSPLAFDSATSGQQPVLGPLNLPSGIYRVTVATNGFFIAHLEAASGKCDAGFGGLFNLSSGQAKGGASALLTSDQCSALVSISNVTDAWKLQFQQITDATPKITRLRFDNASDGTQPVIGPLDLPSGTYRVRVVTNGFFIAHLDAVSGICDAGFMGLFNLSSGQANNGAETLLHSTDCVGLIAISNVTEPWTLEFQPIGR